MTNHFSPRRRKPPGTRSAVVAIREGSEPASRLGHGVGVLALAAQGGAEVAVDLRRRAEAEHVVAALDRPPDRVRRAPELLVHEHGLDGFMPKIQ